ncbi:monovalent cation/H(+) antiporter subunit G [Desulforamulus aquiferis]|uniref:Monovalent cation/H(+) antiporter subunit G n=1 Tax=Desulforamulus aquiferis TaxID=1397668 RepID=A0AAW7ZFE5_9FIRM|nr:monovalent cation/H(+) antiporter subunit G [Desulforamulus aquiferis]MDO7787746.1 monovalent cation/H(+) antiporter subunit G [Desulforamulus aquiferis]
MDIDIRIIFTGLFLALGCFLLLVASIGVIRFPDFFSRMHAAGKADTMGQSCILIGLIIYSGFNLVSLKLLIIMAMIYVINPTATHYLAKAAYMKGVKPWEKGCKYGESDPFGVSCDTSVAGKKAKVKAKR